MSASCNAHPLGTAMSTGTPVEGSQLNLLDRFHACSKRIHHMGPSASTSPARHGVAGSETPVRWSDYPALPPRSFEWLSLEELTAEAVQLGLLTRDEWDGKRHNMTVLGEHYAFTPKQARAFLFGVIGGRRLRAHRAEMDVPCGQE